MSDRAVTPQGSNRNEYSNLVGFRGNQTSMGFRPNNAYGNSTSNLEGERQSAT